MEKVWPCEHVSNTPRGWIYKHDFGGAGYNAKDMQDFENYCSECGAKRPEAGPKRLNELFYNETFAKFSWRSELTVDGKKLCRTLALAAIEWMEKVIKDCYEDDFSNSDLMKRLKEEKETLR